MENEVLDMRYLLIACLLMNAASLLALDGTHSVGGHGANYPTLSEAFTVLSNEGLTGDCELLLNTGSYVGPFILDYADNGYNLTVKAALGHTPTFTNPSSSSTQNYIIRIAGVRGIRLQNLYFETTGTYSRALQIENDADDLQITGCTFQGVPNAPTSYTDAIYFTASGIADADDVYIAMNNIVDGGYGIIVNSTSYLNSFSDWEILNNTFSGNYTGMNLQRMNNLRIAGNNIVSASYGVNVSSCTGDFDISRNKVTDCNSGIKVEYINPNPAANIYNNIINVFGSYGLSVNAQGLNIYHNTIQNSNTQTYLIATASFSGTDLRIRKNHFYSSGDAVAVIISSIDPAYSQRNIMEHNNLYSKGRYLVKSSNDYYASIGEYDDLTLCQNLSCFPGLFGEDLQTSSAYLDNIFPSTEVAVDYNNLPRDPDNSDIGAHEYSSDPTHSPLIGQYSIGLGQTFPTIQSFADALHQRGVGGNVSGLLTDPLYEEQVEFFTIPGASSDNIVTLYSAQIPNSTLRFSGQTQADNFILSLNHVSHIILRNMIFETTSTTYSNLILNRGYNQNFEVKYCSFIAPVTASGSGIATPYGYEADNLDILSLSFLGNSTGMEIRGSGWDIVGSSFDNQYNSISGQVCSNIRVEYSSFTNARNSAVSISQAKSCYLLNNRISGTKTGIVLYQDSDPSLVRSMIANNVIDLNGGNACGISVSGSMINILNNSVRVAGTNSQAMYSYQLGANVEIVNNILQSAESFALEVIHHTPTPTTLIDYNCYYTEGINLLKIVDTYTSLDGALVGYPDMNQNSVSINPHLSDDMHTQSPWLRLAGMFRAEITEDMDYELRGDYFDIGADQQQGAITDNRLAGTYTVGESSSDYQTITAALADLELWGTNGNVILQIASGIYAGKLSMRNFPKTNPTDIAVINGSDDTVIVVDPTPGQDFDNYVFKLIGTNGLTLSNLKLQRTSNNNYATYLVLDGRCDNVLISNCDFDLSGGTQNNSNAINTYDNQGSNLVVDSCSFSDGNYGISMSGPYYGTLSYSSVQINNCDFNNVKYPVNMQKAVDVQIIGNVITGSYQAMALSYLSGAGQIRNNRIHESSLYGSYSSYIGISLSNCNGDFGQAFQIINNIIFIDQSSAQSATALSISYSSHLYLNHNTIISDNASYNEYGSALDINTVTLSSFWNNVFSSPSGGYAARITNCSDYFFQNNAWYSSAKHMVSLNGVLKSKSELLSEIDPQGYIANPLPNSDGYAQCSYLKHKAASTTNNSDIDGNPFGNPADLGASVVPDFGDPLSGTITIGSGADYSDLATAFTALTRRGLSGNLALQINPGEYITKTTLSYVPGSHLYSVDLVGGIDQNAPIVKNNASSANENFILTLNNIHNLNIRDIAFQATNPSYCGIIKILRYTEDLMISNCSFVVPANATNSQENTAFYSGNAILQDVRIEDSYFMNNPWSIYAYAPQQSDGSLVIQDNHFENNYYAAYFSYITELAFERNEIVDFRYMGLQLNTGITNSIVNANSITGNGNQALYLSNLGSSGEHRIFSNYLRTGPNSTSTLYISGTGNVQAYHNTVVNSSLNSQSLAFGFDSSSSNISFLNNICVADQGLAAYFQSLSHFDSGEYTHNLYYSSANNLVRLGTEFFSNSLAWNLSTGDQYSWFENPLLEADTFIISPASPARNKGTNLAEASLDIMGNHRDNPPDLGCYETYIFNLDTPQNPSLILSSDGSSLNLSWDMVPGAGLYIVQIASDPLSPDWQDMPGMSTGQLSISIPVPELPKAFFRVRAIGPQ